jgi:hypothetical protein
MKSRLKAGEALPFIIFPIIPSIILMQNKWKESTVLSFAKK